MQPRTSLIAGEIDKANYNKKSANVDAVTKIHSRTKSTVLGVVFESIPIAIRSRLCISNQYQV